MEKFPSITGEDNDNLEEMKTAINAQQNKESSIKREE